MHLVNPNVETITPDMAAFLLRHNTKNRNLRRGHVDRIAQDIVQGRWVENGATIVIGADGVLIDGQHRLAAVVKAGVPIVSVVVRGVSAAAMPTVDSNIARSAADVAQLTGITNSNAVVGAARLLIALKYGDIYQKRKTSNSAVLEFLLRHPGIEESARAMSPVRDIVPRSIGVAWHYLASVSKNSNRLNAAVEVLRTGVPSYKGDAMHVFRERIIQLSGAERNGSQQARMSIFWTMIAMWDGFVYREYAVKCKLRKVPSTMDGVDLQML